MQVGRWEERLILPLEVRFQVGIWKHFVLLLTGGITCKQYRKVDGNGFAKLLATFNKSIRIHVVLIAYMEVGLGHPSPWLV